MTKIEKVLSIANDLSLGNIVKDLEKIKMRALGVDVELIIPLVGEFSSGKTTLINALTDSKKLETATKPTTATIYKVHFGCPAFHANVLTENGETLEIDNVENLSNEGLADATVVSVFDTSNRVPSSTILVDTPGLSSPDPRHKQTLVDFLPYADAVFLVTDINQQITKSLSDFITTMELAKCPVFLVVTKCDTKSPKEIEQVKRYISENSKLPIQQIACVSAVKDDLQEFYHLLKEIQKDKNNIIKRIDEQRVKLITGNICIHIQDLLKATSSKETLNEAVFQQEQDLKRLNRIIERVVDESKSEIEEVERNVVRKFESVIFDRLDAIAASKGANLDFEANSTIHNTASLLFNEYKSEIQSHLYAKVREQKDKVGTISLQSLSTLDISSLSIPDLTYNLNLNAIGHENDKAFAIGTKVVLGVAVAAAAVCAAPAILGTGSAAAGSAGSAAAASGAGVAGSGAAAGKVALAAGALDTATDVASVASNVATRKRIAKALNAASEIAQDSERKYVKINEIDSKYQTQENKGMVESMIGHFTDGMGKPQRRRAIRNYIDDNLAPEFRMNLRSINQLLVNSISESLFQETAEVINSKKDTLEKLKAEYAEEQEAYERQVKKLKNYKTELAII